MWRSLALLCAFSFIVFGQDTRGSILGRVTDASDAVVVGAKVEALNVDTGVRLATVTNRSGDYAFPLLVPGPYTVTVDSPVQPDDQTFSTATPNDINDPIAGWANASSLKLNRFLGELRERGLAAFRSFAKGNAVSWGPESNLDYLVFDGAGKVRASGVFRDRCAIGK